MEALLTVHVAERIDMYHQRDCRNDNQHHDRDGIQEDTHVEMQIAQRQPSEVIGNDGSVCAISQTVGTEIGEGRPIGKHGNQSQRCRADKTSSLMRHLHASKRKNHEGQRRQQKDQK